MVGTHGTGKDLLLKLMLSSLSLRLLREMHLCHSTFQIFEIFPLLSVAMFSAGLSTMQIQKSCIGWVAPQKSFMQYVFH
jgi:hypothetical protein